MSEKQLTTSPNHLPSNPELDALCELIRHEKVILWIGSGFSSYAGYPTGSQLRDVIITALSELQIGGHDLYSKSLKEVADYYVAAKDRDSLIELLKDYYGNIPQRYEVHESLALINRVKYIITTNYDPLFEHAYGERIEKITHDEDLPKSSDYPEKTILLKIHGDLSDPDSIVITSADYAKFDDKDSIVWGKIKSLLAEYSVVFIGYSISDPHVEEMLGDINERLKGQRHSYYFIDSKIDEEKRVHLSDYGLHFIEMDAVEAINYVTEKAIQYSYLDCMGNPTLLTKSDPIFESRGFRVKRTITDGKITHVSLIPFRPNVKNTFTLSLSSKSGEKKELKGFYDCVAGKSFEPIRLTEGATHITIRNAKVNGIFTFDPALPHLKELLIIPHPSKIDTVDLQLQTHPIRLANLPMKIYKSETLLKLEIQDPDFTFTLITNLGTHENTASFSVHNLLPNIERARDIYTLFIGWLQGDTIELLSDGFPRPLLIPSSPIIEGAIDYPQMQDILKFYNNLSDIQTILKVKLHIPDKITSNDLESIQDIVMLIQGNKQKITEISGTIRLLTKKLSPIVDSDSLTIEGSYLMNFIMLFGKKIQVPIRFKGVHMIFDDAGKILQLAREGIKEMKVIMKSKTGELYICFEPQLMENLNSFKVESEAI